MEDLLPRARDWAAADQHLGDRAELLALIGRVESGDSGARKDLEERFQGPLAFGTAGLRGLIGAGESRMNDAVVLRTTLGLVRYLSDFVPGARERGWRRFGEHGPRRSVRPRGRDLDAGGGAGHPTQEPQGVGPAGWRCAVLRR